jgi:hypothetical protein
MADPLPQLLQPKPQQLQPYQGRVVIERSALHLKMEKLATFIESPLFGNIDVAEKERLTQQFHAMQKYLDILDERIKAFR